MDIETVAGRSRADFRVPLAPDRLVGRLRETIEAGRRFVLLEADEAHADLAVRFNRRTWGGRIHLRFVRLDAASSMVVGEWHPRRAVRGAFFRGEDDLRALAVLLGSAD